MIRRITSAGLKVLAAIVLSIGGLYLFEVYESVNDPVAAADGWWMYPRQPIDISPQAVATVAAGKISSLYANLDYKGPLTWDVRRHLPDPRQAHIKSSAYGFYTEFPVDSFPAKEKNEFRVILFGGSGALGYGASTNAQMMYSALERQLQSAVSDLGIRVRVINLAMAGHTAVDSSAVLRAFGHKLQPDLILGYSGPNDIAQFPLGFFNAACASHLENLLNSTFVQPDWIRTLGEHFPALFYRYALATSIKKNFYLQKYREQAQQECLRDLGVDATRGRLASAVYRDAAVPMFLRHIEAIKRDFCGIPMMISWVVLHDGERAIYDRGMTDFDPKTNPVVVLEGAGARFYNPERRRVHLMSKAPGGREPTWEEIIRSSPAHDLAEGIVDIDNDRSLQYAVTISNRSANGFNINRIDGGKIYYLVLPARHDTPLPTSDAVRSKGTRLRAGSVPYKFDPASLTDNEVPTVYFVMKDKRGLSRVLIAKDHDEMQKASAQSTGTYYAIAAASGDGPRSVYSLYTEDQLTKFRRAGGVYRKLYETSKAKLDGYMNRYWYFQDTDRAAHAIDPATVPGLTPTSLQVHGDDVGQGLIAKVIAADLAPVVRDLARDPDRPGCSRPENIVDRASPPTGAVRDSRAY